MLHRLGVDVGDEQRAADVVAARRSRERQDRQDLERRALDLASAVRKTRREASLAHADWQRSPSPERPAEVEGANRNRSQLEERLRELLCWDAALWIDVMLAAGG